MNKWMKKMSFKGNFDNEKDYLKAMNFMAEDSVRTGIIAVRVIMFFELIMVLILAFSSDIYSDLYTALYFFAYVFLTIVSLIVHTLLYGAIKRKIDLKKRVLFSTYFYNAMLLVWALFITFLDISKSGYFLSMVYMTIIVIIPVAAFVEPLYYIALNVVGSVSVIVMLFSYCNMNYNRGNLINFVVFILISMVAGCAYSIVRIKGYVNRVQLARANEQLQYAAEHDYLSGLFNRQKLGTVSMEMWKRCLDKNMVFTCALCDLDNFKKFNDMYGHDCGDECILTLARIFCNTLKDQDTICFRYGGEEFLVLFPGKSYEDAYNIMAEIQDELRNARLEGVNDGIHVTMSVGIYSSKPNDSSKITSYFTCADKYMYEAKMAGKDCIRGADES